MFPVGAVLSEVASNAAFEEFVGFAAAESEAETIAEAASIEGVSLFYYEDLFFASSALKLPLTSPSNYFLDPKNRCFYIWNGKGQTDAQETQCTSLL